MTKTTQTHTSSWNPDISIWLSIDPLSDKYPSLSPYNYCANNPIKYVDPDGREIGDPPTTQQRVKINKLMVEGFTDLAKQYGEYQYRNYWERVPFETDSDINTKDHKVSVGFSGIVPYSNKMSSFSNDRDWDLTVAIGDQFAKCNVAFYIKKNRNDMIATNLYFSNGIETSGPNSEQWGYLVKFRNNKKDVVAILNFNSKKEIYLVKNVFRKEAINTYLNYVLINKGQETYNNEKSKIDKTGKLPLE